MQTIEASPSKPSLTKHETPKINYLIWIWTLVTPILLVGFHLEYQDLPYLTAVLACFYTISFIGFLLMFSKAKKAGAILYIIGCVIFAPISFIGIFGAKRIIDTIDKINFYSENSYTQKKPNALYLHKESTADLQLFGGIVTFIICLAVSFAAGQILGVTALALFFAFIGFYNKGRELISLYDDHLEAKLGPISRVAFIKYSDIVETKSAKKSHIVVYNKKNKSKKLNISSTLLEDHDFLELIKTTNKLATENQK